MRISLSFENENKFTFLGAVAPSLSGSACASASASTSAFCVLLCGLESERDISIGHVLVFYEVW